ncbi:hypothetical protein O9929_08555 [Vibrio lentus]|nr:hypothetical protein [Vibrio lentus]
MDAQLQLQFHGECSDEEIPDISSPLDSGMTNELKVINEWLCNRCGVEMGEALKKKLERHSLQRGTSVIGISL